MEYMGDFMLNLVAMHIGGIYRMLEMLIKYGAMMVFSFFVYLKLLNTKVQQRIYLYYFLYLLIALPCIYVLTNFTSFTFIFMDILFTIFVISKIKLSLNLSITASIISFGITYLIYLISAVLVSFLEVLIASLLDNQFVNHLFATIYTVLLQLLIIIILFRFKRFNKGMPFLIEHGSGDVFVFISVSLLIAASFIGGNNAEYIYIVPFFFVLISGLIVLFWWRISLSKKYLEKIKEQEKKILHEEIHTKQSEISQLKQQNEELSKIIHKDNKLIPALDFAVRQYLLSVESEPDNAARLEKGETLLSQIESASRERTGIITSYESSSKSLPTTGVPSVDSLLMYMLQKCKEQQIDFNLSVSGSVKYFTENIATEQDINTLLADLIENAIIATKKCVPRNILVHIGIAENCYSVSIFDNGIPFTPETINDIGLKRTTTHAGEGGSGIGLVTAFEILKKYRASFVIEDISDNVLYTKNVSICFDSLGQFRIKSEHVGLFSAREDILFMSDIGA